MILKKKLKTTSTTHSYDKHIAKLDTVGYNPKTIDEDIQRACDVS